MPSLNKRALAKYMDDESLPFPERVAKCMTYQAALYTITGGTLEELDFEDEIDTEELEGCAKKLRDLGIEDYAKRAYGSEDPEQVDLKALKYEYFLYQSVELLDLQDAVQQAAVKESLRDKLLNWERKGRVPAQDYWLHKKREQDAEQEKPFREEDQSVYEYEASNEVWRDYISGFFYRGGIGARPVTDQTIELIKTQPYDKLTLRNKRTVEHLKRGDMNAVARARRETEKSFTFLRKEDLKSAQEAGRNLNRRMAACTGDVAQTQEWRDVNAAVFKFQTAESPEKAAAASAEVLLAVEKFTKGKKNAHQSEEVSTCVNLALEALGTTIPNAPENPSVQPLVDRFNQVRRQRLQFGSLVTLRDNHAPSKNMTNREITASWKERMNQFVESELRRPTVRNGVATVSSEEQALESMAIAVALEEAREGRINGRNNLHEELENRVETLKQDPILQEMAHGAATDRQQAAEMAMNADGFSTYIKTSYDQTLRQNREQAEQSAEEQIRQQKEKIEQYRAQQQKLEENYRAGQKAPEPPKAEVKQQEEIKEAGTGALLV